MDKKIYSESNWFFERSSGYAGYRCVKCGTWVYANQYPEKQKFKCDCVKK